MRKKGIKFKFWGNVVKKREMVIHRSETCPKEIQNIMLNCKTFAVVDLHLPVTSRGLCARLWWLICDITGTLCTPCDTSSHVASAKSNLIDDSKKTPTNYCQKAVESKSLLHTAKLRISISVILQERQKTELHVKSNFDFKIFYR